MEAALLCLALLHCMRGLGLQRLGQVRQHALRAAAPAATGFLQFLVRYTLRLPAAAPVKAPYSSSGTPNFAPDAPLAGRYRLKASAPDRSDVIAEGDISTASQVVDFSFAP